MISQEIEVITLSNGFIRTIAKKAFKKGEWVISIEGKRTNVRDRYTIQIGNNSHIIPTKNSGKYINHSCLPNLQVRDSTEFYALKDIAQGEQITFDYNSTEDELAEEFDCLCGNENCRGRIS